MTTWILFLLKFGIFSLFALVIFLVLFALLGTIIHYFYAKKIYNLGDQFLFWSLRREPQEIYNLCDSEFRSTTSLAEVVLLSETLSGLVEPNEKVIWHRTHIKKRKGHATIHGLIYGKGKVRFNLVLTAHRARNHSWYIRSLSLNRNFSRSTDRSD